MHECVLELTVYARDAGLDVQKRQSGHVSDHSSTSALTFANHENPVFSVLGTGDLPVSNDGWEHPVSGDEALRDMQQENASEVPEKVASPNEPVALTIEPETPSLGGDLTGPTTPNIVERPQRPQGEH